MNQVSKKAIDFASCSSKQRALNSYKRLLRARAVVFKGDDHAMKESLAAIRESFEKNRHLNDQEDILKQIEIADQAEEILRKEVIQARFVSNDTIRVNVRLDNVNHNKTFEFVNDD